MKSIALRKKNVRILTIAAMASFFAAATALAQSSGNFTASVDNTVCSINSTSPPSPGGTGGNFIFTGSSGASLSDTIKLPNSSPAILVTPSLETGLYTNTLSSSTSANETAAVVVTVSDSFGTPPQTMVLSPNQTCVDTVGTGCTTPSSTCKCGLVYDERFQLLNTVLGSGESVQLIQSTLSAHSFNFVEGSAPGGIHTITMAWYFGCDSGSGSLSTGACKTTFAANTAAACAGPGTLTVQQVQNFQHDSQVQSTGP